MSDSTHTPTNRPVPRETQRHSSQTPPRYPGDSGPELQLAVVTYDESPDRGTIHPPGLSGMERRETWISVDMSVVADLTLWR
jgi:hypothetical protein